MTREDLTYRRIERQVCYQGARDARCLTLILTLTQQTLAQPD